MQMIQETSLRITESMVYITLINKVIKKYPAQLWWGEWGGVV